MKIIENFNDYEVLSTSNGYKYERWGKYYLKRPDPEIIWPGNENIKVNAVYERSSTGGGNWTLNNVPSSWTVNYKDLKFNLKLFHLHHSTYTTSLLYLIENVIFL